jgi:uncharacterized protein (TIGR02594 family)
MTAYDLAHRYMGVAELGGPDDHPLIQWWHSLCRLGFNAADEIPWCSSFVNGIAWELRLPRTYSAAARSWLRVGVVIPPAAATIGYDVVVLSRGPLPQPDAGTLDAPGHVGFFAGYEPGEDWVWILGGNQRNAVSIQRYPRARILGVRRLQNEVPS